MGPRAEDLSSVDRNVIAAEENGRDDLSRECRLAREIRRCR
jgi:hypothetical protein